VGVGAKVANAAQALICKNIQLALEIQEGQRALKLNARAEKAKEGFDRDAAQRLRNKTYQVALQIKAKQKALEQGERAREGLKKVNTAVTRANIIRRIKGARGRKHMAVH
jgi:hypothetical protein